MKIAVVGSRSFKGERAYDAMCSILGVCDFDEVISGGASGTDRLAERYSQEHDIPLHVFPAEWDKFQGNSAAYERNKLIVAEADAVIAFWDGKSKGTFMTMKLARDARKTLMIVRTDLLFSEEDDDAPA